MSDLPYTKDTTQEEGAGTVDGIFCPEHKKVGAIYFFLVMVPFLPSSSLGVRHDDHNACGGWNGSLFPVGIYDSVQKHK